MKTIRLYGSPMVSRVQSHHTSPSMSEPRVVAGDAADGRSDRSLLSSPLTQLLLYYSQPYDKDTSGVTGGETRQAARYSSSREALMHEKRDAALRGGTQRCDLGLEKEPWISNHRRRPVLAAAAVAATATELGRGNHPLADPRPNENQKSWHDPSSEEHRPVSSRSLEVLRTGTYSFPLPTLSCYSACLTTPPANLCLR